MRRDERARTGRARKSFETKNVEERSRIRIRKSNINNEPNDQTETVRGDSKPRGPSKAYSRYVGRKRAKGRKQKAKGGTGPGRQEVESQRISSRDERVDGRESELLDERWHERGEG